MAIDPDDRLRTAALLFLKELSARNGGIASWNELHRFEFEGNRTPLIGQTGIRKLRGHEAALTILTTYRLRPEDRPYDDTIGSDLYPRYKWRGSDPTHRDNVALRAAMKLGKPLGWFEGIETGVYLVHVPVWLVGEEPDEQQFVVALDATMREQWQPETIFSEADLILRRAYAERVVRQRLHQPMFSRRVIKAYRSQCALCRLRVPELLQAAHIKEDSEGGEPVVSNGIAMCAIHHLAFDRFVLGVRPDYVVEVRDDVLAARDGPTLQHALKGIHHSVLTLPTRQPARPDPTLLDERYERFRAAG